MTEQDQSRLAQLAGRFAAKAGYWWLRYLRFHQRGKELEKCASPLCGNQWHDHVADVRLCREHHPAYDDHVFPVTL